MDLLSIGRDAVRLTTYNRSVLVEEELNRLAQIELGLDSLTEIVDAGRPAVARTTRRLAVQIGQHSFLSRRRDVLYYWYIHSSK